MPCFHKINNKANIQHPQLKESYLKIQLTTFIIRKDIN